MENEELQSYNALSLFYRGEYKKIEQARRNYDSWQAAWKDAGKESDIKKEKEWEKLQKHNISLILSESDTFPLLLKEIPWAPLGLFARGNIEKNQEGISIVGTRKASPQGLFIARQFASELGSMGITVISGLALGIDTAAHTGALEGKGRTIAVLANGLERVYPPHNARIAEGIVAQGGALLSEYPIGSPTFPQRFLERNRIISGLSKGIIVIEAPARSGALATARFALEQNREVFVVPGSITSQNYAGSHTLIKEGATLVTSVQDILDAIHFNVNVGDNLVEQKQDSLGNIQKIILNVLRIAGSELSPEVIAQQANLSLPQVHEELSILIIEGFIQEKAGKYFIV